MAFSTTRATLTLKMGAFMRISCPYCRYESVVDPGTIPERVKAAMCPKCAQRFPFIMRTTALLLPGAPPETAVDKDIWNEPGLREPKPDQPRNTPEQDKAPKAYRKKPAPKKHRLSYHGVDLDLLKILLTNNLITILTAGFYHPWGKTKIWEYLYGSINFMGEGLIYTGNGKELSGAMAKASVLALLAFAAAYALYSFVHPALGVLAAPAFFFAVNYWMVSSLRYRLSRTNWQGLTFSFKGGAWECFKLNSKGIILTLLTLGLYSPYFHAKKKEFWISNTWHDTIRFRYTGDGKELWNEFMLAFMLAIPTLGICWFWYKAQKLSYDWENTFYGDLRFSFNATGGQVLTLQAVNMLLLLSTLGLAAPLVASRKIRFVSKHLKVTGSIKSAEEKQAEDLAGC